MNTPSIDFTFGVNRQALSVMHLLHGVWGDIEGHIRTAVWYNGRENGIVLSYSPCCSRGPGSGILDSKAILNIAFFSHRIRDEIVAVICHSDSLGVNPPSVETHGDQFYPNGSSHSDIAHSVGSAQVDKMSQWIIKQLHDHYNVYLKAIEDAGLWWDAP